MELNHIYATIQEDLDRVKDEIKSISKIDFAWLSEQLHYLSHGIGKGIRPALTLLSGKLYEYNLDYLMPMAVSVELLHTATLVHDDAIDKSSVRRSCQASVSVINNSGRSQPQTTARSGTAPATSSGETTSSPWPASD